LSFKRIIGLLILEILFFSGMLRAQDLPSACSNGKVRYRMRGLPGSSFVWTIVGGQQIAQYATGDSIDVKWNNQSGIHCLTCQEYVSSGCPGKPITVDINVINLSLDIGTTVYICEGQTVELNAGNGFTRYLWQDGSSGKTLKVSAPGIYWAEVSQGKCTVRDSMEVLLSPTPIVNLGRDTSICYPNRLLLDAGNPGMIYEWSTGSLDQTIWANEGDGLVWVKVSNINRCTGSDSINVQLCSPLNYLFIPNVFTPNGDGENDVWRIGGVQYFPLMTVTLFDRWGRLIFVSEPGYPKPWNGERNGKLLPIDAYFYIIDLKNGFEPIRGSVTLVP
jgi:gliding motility-associated-like protein